MDRSAEDGHQRRPGGNWFTGIEAEAVSENLPAKAKVDAAQVLNGFSFSLAVPQIFLGAVTAASSSWEEQDLCSATSKREKRPELQKI